MAMYGYVFLCMAMYGYVGLCRGMYGYVGLCRAVYGVNINNKISHGKCNSRQCLPTTR